MTTNLGEHSVTMYGRTFFRELQKGGASWLIGQLWWERGIGGRMKRTYGVVRCINVALQWTNGVVQ